MKKALAMFLTLAMAVCTLAGCGGAASSASAAASTPASKAESTASGETVTLRVSLWDYSNVNYFKTMFAEFEKAYPNIKIEPVEASAAEYDDLIQVKMSSKENFDVVFTKGTPALSALIAKGHVLALDDLIAADSNFDKSKYAGLIEQLTLDGKTYGVPFRKDNNLLYYNKDLFDAAGVAYPEDGMNLDDFSALAKKMTSGEGAEKVYGAHIHTWAGMIGAMPRRLDAWSYLDDNMETLKPYYECVLGMMDEGSIMDYGELKATSTHYSGVFYNQQAAMLPMGTWFINMLLENADFNWGVCTLPNEKGSGNDTAMGGVTPVSIGAYAEHPEEAWQLIKFITGKEGAPILAATGILPGYSSDEINTIFDDMATKKAGVPEKLSKYIDIDTYIIQEPMSAKGRERVQVLNEEHDLIMTKSISLDDGIKEMNDRLADLK